MRRAAVAFTTLCAVLVVAPSAKADAMFSAPYPHGHADGAARPGLVWGTAATEQSADPETGRLGTSAEVTGESPKYGTGAFGAYVASPYAQSIALMRLSTPVVRGFYDVTVTYDDLVGSATAIRDGLRIKGTSNDDPFGLCFISAPCLNHRSLAVTQLHLDLSARPCAVGSSCPADTTRFRASPITACSRSEDDPDTECRSSPQVSSGGMAATIEVLRTGRLDLAVSLVSFVDVWGKATAASDAALTVQSVAVERIE